MTLERIRVFTIILMLSATGAGTSNASELRIAEKVARDGSSVAIEVTLDGEQPLAALAFAVEFDSSRLHFDARAASAGVLQNIHVRVPDGFAASTFTLEDDLIGISVYNRERPLRSIPGGTIATLLFETKPRAEGHAFVRLAAAPPPTAADVNGEAVALGSRAAGGVTIIPRRGVLTTSPAQLVFPTVEPADTAETRRIVVTNNGSAPLRLDRVSLAGGDDAFRIDAASLPWTIPPGASRLIEVTFRPGSLGAYSTQLVIDYDAGSPSTHIIGVSGDSVPEGSAVYATRAIVPAVARLEGSNGSLWKSTLSLANVGGRAAKARMTLYAFGKVAGETNLELSANSSRSFDDIAREMFELDTTSGYLVVESTTPDLVVRSTTTNVTTDNERGQSVPVVAWSQLYHDGETAYLLGLERSRRRRSNVALLNAAESDAVLRVDLRRGNGELVASKEYLIPGNFLMQSIDIFEGIDDDDLLLSASCVSRDCTFFAYASTTSENGTPIFQSAR